MKYPDITNVNFSGSVFSTESNDDGVSWSDPAGQQTNKQIKFRVNTYNNVQLIVKANYGWSVMKNYYLNRGFPTC